MKTFIIAGFFLIVIIVLFFWNFSTTKNDSIILGQELATASEKEREIIDSGNYSKSPLLNFSYSKWASEQSLINPKENELDSTIIEMCKKFKNDNNLNRGKIRKSIRQDDIYTLLEFAKRATVFGVRRKEAAYIMNGFVAVAMIETKRCDYRDILVTLSFLNFGVDNLNLNTSMIFNEAVMISEFNTAKLIKQFSERNIKDKSLEEVGGYTPVKTKNGIAFAETE